MIWSAQTTVCALLVLDAGLTIAEVARVAGIHRATLTRAVKTEEVIRGLKTAEEITLRREQDLRHIANVTDMTRRYD